MNQELLNQTKAMFDSPDKWNAFLEILYEKDNIRNQWYLNLKEDITKTFSTDYFSKEWDIKIRGNFSYQWFLKAYGENSISLWIEDGILSLFASETHDIEEVYKLIKSENYAPLVNCFTRIDVSFQGGYIIKEERNFTFGVSTDERFDFEKLAWFAGNKTKELTKQIVDKVNRFRLNEEITNLLSELNRQTKKQ